MITNEHENLLQGGAKLEGLGPAAARLDSELEEELEGEGEAEGEGELERAEHPMEHLMGLA